MAYDTALLLLYVLGGLTSLMLIGVLGEMYRSKTIANKPKQTAVLLVKSPLELELKRARLTRKGEIIVEDGDNVLLYKPPSDYYPIEVKIGRRVYKAYIVNRDVHAFYTIPTIGEDEISGEVEVQGRKISLNKMMLDPKILFTYIGSKSMEKLIKPLRVGKAEAVGYIAIGGIMVLMMIFFLLPMMGYHITIGG
ncbi:MAG: hypothetical protein F7C36_00400 [Desulfurococcales archaeon]|nr:hypothetical protein [Desulfurococcales archaeon]